MLKSGTFLGLEYQLEHQSPRHLSLGNKPRVCVCVHTHTQSDFSKVQNSTPPKDQIYKQATELNPFLSQQKIGKGPSFAIKFPESSFDASSH